MINNNPAINHSEDLVSLRSIVCGAAPLGETDILRFRDITNGKIDFFQAYGMTETSPLCTIETKAYEGGRKIGGSGFLIPNTQAKFVSIDNPDNQEALGKKEDGQLLIKGPQVLQCYASIEM